MWGKSGKIPDKKYKIIPRWCQRKIANRKCQKGAKGGKEVGEICPGTDGVENKWKK